LYEQVEFENFFVLTAISLIYFSLHEQLLLNLLRKQKTFSLHRRLMFASTWFTFASNFSHPLFNSSEHQILNMNNCNNLFSLCKIYKYFPSDKSNRCFNDVTQKNRVCWKSLTKFSVNREKILSEFKAKLLPINDAFIYPEKCKCLIQHCEICWENFQCFFHHVNTKKTFISVCMFEFVQQKNNWHFTTLLLCSNLFFDFFHSSYSCHQCISLMCSVDSTEAKCKTDYLKYNFNGAKVKCIFHSDEEIYLAGKSFDASTYITLHFNQM
jgi:hypothetical protein